jgi:hypothetical protein
VDLQAIKTSVNMRTKSLLETTTDTKECLHEELGLVIQVKTQMMRTLVDTTWQGLKAKLAEVEAQAERWSCQGTGTTIGMVQTPKFDGLMSLVIPMAVQDHDRTTGQSAINKAAYLVAALNEPLHTFYIASPFQMKYEEVTVVLKNCCRDHHLAEAFHAQLRRRVQHAGESALIFCHH